MAQLVPIPYQPGYKVTPAFLARLLQACQIAGHNILVSDAWRAYAEQAYYYDLYLHHGGNVASNPDTGQRNHMRGSAVDIVNKSDRSAMLAAGFTPDPDEWWHFNDPNWANTPIIMTDDSGAVQSSSPTITGDMDMSFSLVKDAQSATIWVVSLETGIYTGVGSPYHVQLLQRAKVNNAGDPMLRGELDIVRAYLSAINPAPVIPAATGTATPWKPTAEQLAAIGAGVKVPAFPTKLTGALS